MGSATSSRSAAAFVADAVLFAAQHRCNILVGAQAALDLFLNKLRPGLVGKLMVARGRHHPHCKQLFWAALGAGWFKLARRQGR